MRRRRRRRHAGKLASRRRRRRRGRYALTRFRRRRRRRQRWCACRLPCPLSRLFKLRLDVAHLFVGERVASLFQFRVFRRLRVGSLCLRIARPRRNRNAFGFGFGFVDAGAHHFRCQRPPKPAVAVSFQPRRLLGLSLPLLLHERHYFRHVLRGHRAVVVVVAFVALDEPVKPTLRRDLAQHPLQNVAGEHLEHVAWCERFAVAW